MFTYSEIAVNAASGIPCIFVSRLLLNTYYVIRKFKFTDNTSYDENILRATGLVVMSGGRTGNHYN